MSGFKLADFGIAGELQGSLLKRNTMIGTPFFLDPEVIVNEDGYGTMVDIWSFGISLLEIADKQPLATVDPMRVNTNGRPCLIKEAILKPCTNS